MSYQLGSHRLGEFTQMKSAIQNGDWSEAASQMGNSEYCSQVPTRCASNQALMRGGSR